MKRFLRITGGLLGIIRAWFQQLYNRYINPHFEEFNGDAREICRQIVDRLTEGDFHRTSLGHFDFFWIRDFGTVAESLVQLGHKDEVRQTLNWAMLQYMQAGHITLCIDSHGNTFNAPAKQAIDALPWLLHAMVVSDYKLRPIERSFLDAHLYRYIGKFLHPETGDLRRGVRFAEMRDGVKYERSAYAITMVARMSLCAKKLDLDFPFDVSIYRKLLNEKYWNGRFFKADRRTNAWSSDCGLMPFHLDIIKDTEKAASTCDYIHEMGLEKLYPVEYCQQNDEFSYRFGMGKWIMPDYQGHSIWTWHGTFYLHVLNKYKRPEYGKEYTKMEDLILRHRTFPELLNLDGTWFKTIFYSGDPGMIWAALFLDLPTPQK